MRGVSVSCIALFCLSGCQTGSPSLAVATPEPTAAFAVAVARPETREPRKLNQPPAPRAKDLARPNDPFQARTAPAAQGNTLPHPQLPQPAYPVHQPAAPVVVPPSAPVTSPHAAVGPPDASVSSSPNFSPGSAYVPPVPTSAYIPPTIPRFEPGRSAPPDRPGRAVGQPPRLPGQPSPLPFSTPLGDRRAKEKELEQAYLQSRADALNLKYHGGRAVYSAQSPQVTTSAIAPPVPNMPPSIPGTYGVVDAFKASEAKRAEWQSYRNQPPVGGAPTMPQPPHPSFP